MLDYIGLSKSTLYTKCLVIYGYLRVFALCVTTELVLPAGMFQKTTKSFGKPQLVPPFLTYTDSLILYPGYSYTRVKPGL